MKNFKRFLTLFFISTLTLSVWGASPATLTFTAACGGSGTDSDGNTWTVTSDAAESTYDGTKGIHYGTSKKAVSYLNLTTSGISGTITSISVNASGASGTSAKLNVTVGGSAFDSEKSLTSTATSYSFTGSASGTIVVAITQTSAKVALYCKSISVTYSSGGSPTLSSISVSTAPTKVTYTAGEYFDPTGLVITRTYSNSTSDTYAYAGHASDFTFTPSTSTALTTSNTSVTITYGGKSTTQAITVTSGGGGGSGECSYDLTKASYASGASTTLVTWSSNATATMTLAKNTSGTNANNYLPTSYSSTRFYSNQILTITPKSGKTITSIIFTAKSDSYATTLYNSTWTNATKAVSGSTVTITPTDGTSAVSATIGGTCGFSCVEFVGGSTYTITATVDDAAHGSVSVSGNTITVTPTEGWAPDGYTVTSGTATASQSGNTYTVTPSSDCTIQINFRAAATYTVTIIDNGSSHTETAYEGVPFELPDAGTSTCEDATLLGWATGEYTNHLTGTTTAPTYDAPGTEKDITANTTFTAVYGIVTEDASDVYTEITSADALKTGDYLIVADYSSSLHEAMANAVSSSHMNESSVTITDGKITTTNTAIRWHITKTGDNYTIYNAAVSKYLALSTTSPLLETSAHNFVAAYSAGAWTFESTTVSGYQLAYGTNLNYFESATSQNKPIKLYRRGSAIGSYTSKPHCCHAPLTPLAISSETTNFVGSGTTTISLTGGNAKLITWSCKDEANTDCSSYLSGKSITGATLTLPTNAATKVYTVTATQADNESDPDNIICGATVTLNFTVKAQFTINFKTVDGGSESLYSSITVTDGDTYEMPSLAEDFDCGTSGKSFLGWASTNSATSVEKTAGTNVTATSGATWYACWSTSSAVTLVPLYEKVTSPSSLASGNIVLICNTGATYAIGEQNSNNRAQADVTAYEEDSKNYVYFTGTDVRELTVGKSGDLFTFHDAVEGGYLYAASSGSNHMKTQTTLTNDGKWTVDIASGDEAAATVTAQGSNTRNIMKYNSGSKIFSCYSSGQQAVVLYKKTSKTKAVSTGSGSITTDLDGCTSGPTIRANTNQWITAAAGQKVKTVIDVTAKSFESASTLSATSSNSKFEVSLAATAVPTGPTGLTTTLTVEYTPTESDVTESSTITLQAGDITKTITVNGRSLPEEFLLITKKTLWYALPGNMNDGPNEYPGVEVIPDDGVAPTMVGVAPSTVLYSLLDVTSDRYDGNGTCVRLIGYNSLGLWSNLATSTTSKINIQNKTNAATAIGDNFEWLLTTTDGIQYTIANPHHPQYGAGRRLAYGDKFGLYQEPTIFFIVTAGCTSQPQDVRVSARRVDATFTWVSNASEMTIDLYSDEGMTSLVKSETATSAPYTVLGLSEQTTYWYKLTPGTDVACAVTGTFTTTGPVIDIVEWEVDNAVVFVDKDEAVTPKVIIDGEVEHGVGTGAAATELFFSKYFEGSGNMKLLAFFNGTAHDIDLTNYKIAIKTCGSPANDAAIASSTYTSTVNYEISALGSIKAGQEIILYRWPDYKSDVSDPLGALYACSEDFLTEQGGKSDADEDVRWIQCDGSTKYGPSETTFPAFTFNGNDAICLLKDEVLIDVIGTTGAPGKVKNCANRLNDLGWTINVKNIDYGKASDDPAYDALYAASSKSPTNDTERRAVLAGFKVDLDNEYIDLTTARCILFRDKSVTSGERAVALNTGTEFTTCNDFTYMGESYKSEWNGRQVCMSSTDQSAAGVSNDAKATCNSYQDLGAFDYSSYYKDWSNINPGLELDEHVRNADEKTYNIPIPELAKYSCLNIRFQLKDGDEILTETPVQVPILVTGGRKYTNDAIFNEIVKTDGGDPVYDQSITRCQTCDVVILGNGILEKAASGATNDAAQIGNLKIYPGGKLVVPTSTSYTVNSLSFRRQEDEVPSANIQGTLTIQTTNGTYLDMRVDPTNWHYFSLPYNCKVSDITYSDGITPAKVGSDYLLKKYNGEKRAATQAGGCWEMVAPDEELKKGLGYIFALPGDGKVKREFRFPMSNDVITEDLGPKTIGQVFGYGCDKTDEELGPNHKGWNLIGNPYLLPYETDFTNPLTTGKLIHTPDPWDGKWMIEDNDATRNVHYIVEPRDNGWSEYRQVTIYDYPMKPFTCYFVQIGGSNPEAGQDIDFTAAGTNTSRSSIVRRARVEYEEVEDTHPVWCAVDLISPNGEKDETTLLVSDDFTDNYDMMNDLVKMRGTYYQYAQITTKPVLASRNNAGEMAFNALPDASAAAGVPLNFFAATSGEYTFAYNDKFGREEVKSVMLLDKQTNQWYNLMENNYSFSTGRIDDTSRFILSVRVERKKTPQSITEIEDGTHSTNGPRKILINGHVYILRDGKTYDLTGKKMSNL